MAVPTALTIAGSDCSGGAGIQADLKTFEAFRVFGQSVVTAVVAENTVGVQGVHPVPPAFVARQIDSCLDDIGAAAIKTGMLVDGPTIRAVADALERHGVRDLVVDPVMRAKGGDPLIDPDAVRELVARIFPLAGVVTPNVPEAEALVGRPLATEADFLDAARAIRAMGPRIVVMKGGHNPFTAPDVSIDFVWDGTDWTPLAGPRAPSRNTHGT
ncbi:MAG TPA: bifunctional hydroxymethylpyrimidine kinase/phosphomethylpyrimidine kinase, partial [Myxococcota bacterium]|nr:bifunctional hydroxymethylpyrimidine kinase/phosphomethylpyrimidine kinase [Myxococcota bacterium]